MISRRQLLKVLGMGSAGLAANALFPKFHFGEARADSSSTVLVTLYLSGGWDGCAIAQPAAGLRYDACLAARPTLTKSPSALNLLTDDYGLHPALRNFANLYHRGEAIVFPTAGIAVRNSGSHEEATRDVILGLYDGGKEFSSKGFVANILDLKYQGQTTAEFLAFDMVGGNSVLNDSAANIIKAGNLSGLGFNDGVTSNYGWLQDHLYLLSSNWQGSDQDGKVGKTVRALEATQTRIRQALNNTTYSPTFANNQIGQAFRQAFMAISNFIDVGLEAISISTGGFDTHNNQDPIVGQNQQPMGLSATLLQIDAALFAFVENLRRVGLYNRVCVLALSEFGRTARENGSKGTDHGQGTTYLLAGGAVNGKQLIGNAIEPGDFARSNNSFPVSVPHAAIVSQISEKMGVSRDRLYPPDLLAALPQLPPLFK